MTFDHDTCQVRLVMLIGQIQHETHRSFANAALSNNSLNTMIGLGEYRVEQKNPAKFGDTIPSGLMGCALAA